MNERLLTMGRSDGEGEDWTYAFISHGQEAANVLYRWLLSG